MIQKRNIMSHFKVIINFYINCRIIMKNMIKQIVIKEDTKEKQNSFFYFSFIWGNKLMEETIRIKIIHLYLTVPNLFDASDDATDFLNDK